jgi:hypothetical protein
MNGEVIDSWVRSLSTYFKTYPGMIEEEKLQITSLQLEGIAQAWWDAQTDTSSLVVDLGDPPVATPPPIGSWDTFCQALWNHFYPPGYRQTLLARWLQLCQLSGQSVQRYIEVFTKLCIQLQIQDPEEVLIVKFNSGLLLFIHREVDLFEISSLDKAFLRALDVEWKLSPHLRSPLSKVGPSSTPSSPASPTSPKPRKWCSYHKSQFHSSVECHVLHNQNLSRLYSLMLLSPPRAQCPPLS